MNTKKLKELRNALSCWQDDYDCDDDKEQYDMFGAAIDAVSRLEAAELEIEGLKRFQDLNLKIKQAMHERFTRAERERDELRAEQAEHDEQIARMESKFSLAKRALDSKTARCEKAEAELRRRDAEAGEPYGYVHKSLYEAVGSAGLSNDHEAYRDSPTHIALYTAAPPAVLPPKYADELTVRAELIEAYSKTQCEVAQELGCDSDNESILKAICEIKELGAQQQKVVELPTPYDIGKGDRRYYDIAGWHFDREELIAALDAAGVKWEVKK